MLPTVYQLPMELWNKAIQIYKWKVKNKDLNTNTSLGAISILMLFKDKIRCHDYGWV